MKKLVLVILLLSILDLTGCTGMASIAGTPFKCIGDSANVLDAGQEDSLSKLLSDFEKSSSVQIAAILVNSTNGKSIDDYTMEKFNSIGLGQNKINNGALIVIAVEDRKVRLTVGYGLEWCINDETSYEIIQKMISSLKIGNYYEALNTGFNEIIQYSRDVSWNIAYTDIAKVQADGDKAINSILTFKAENSDPAAARLTVFAADGSRVVINATSHMGDLANIINSGNAVITGRIKSVKPLELDLLGAGKSK